MQDRIIGPLTMIQFLYAVLGGGLCYAIISSVKGPFSWVLVTPIALFTLAMIFLKINERPFLDFLFALAYFMSAPKKRVWHHEGFADMGVEIYKAKQAVNNNIQTKHFSHEQIHEAAEKNDTGTGRII